MTAFTKILGGGVAIAALAVAAPAAAQFFPGMGYPGVGYGYETPGYGGFGYGVNSQAAVAQCTAAVQARLGGYGYGYGYGAGGRVLGVSHVEPGITGGLLVRGVATSGGYAGYGYSGQTPNLTWRCRTDFRGLVVDVDIRPARPSYGTYGTYGNYGYTPYNNYDYSQYGYVRY
jgi:hypothetical protein